MASLTIYPSDDGFNNNISGAYPSEDFITSGATSSSNAIKNTAFLFFDTQDAATGLTGKTITALTLRLYGLFYGDVNQVAAWVVYTDQNEVWGRTLDAADPLSPGYGTYAEGYFIGLTVGVYNDFVIPVAHMGDRASKFTNCAIEAQLGDVGPANIDFGAVESILSKRPQLVITYADDSPPQRTLMGVGL